MDVDNAAIKRQVWSAHEVQKSHSVPTAIKTVVDWMSSFITKPHHDLGRTGVVCPFVSHALRLQSLWLAVVNDMSLCEGVMCDIVRKYMEVYLSLEPRSGEAVQLKALLLIFPHISRQQACSLIGRVQRIMKPNFVDAGLMLGEFYPESESPGLHNPHFRPLRSPIPLLVYRQMVPNDLAFLMKPADPPQRHIQFLGAYLRLLEADLSPERLREARAALAAAQSRISLQRRSSSASPSE